MKLCFIVLACAMYCHAHAQSTRIERLDSLFRSLNATGKFSGNVLIAERGKAIYQKSFGFADESKGQELNAGSLSLLGSVSKQFTAFAIVLLHQQGKLSYNDSLRQFLPALPYSGITIRQLLNHTSGIPDYIFLMDKEWDKTKYASNKDMMDMLVQYHPPMMFAPGTKYAYSNTGYAILALIIEKVSGMSYADFMEQHVFKPLGMNRTIIYTRRYLPRPVTNYALGYIYDDSIHKYVLPEQSNKFKFSLWEDGIVGEDGVNSTVMDMLRWDRSLYKNNLINASALNEIFIPGTVTEGQSDYGFGWHIKSFDGYGRIAWHSGGWPGYMAYIERHMDTDKTIIILRNKFSPDLKLPIDAVRAVLYGK